MKTKANRSRSPNRSRSLAEKRSLAAHKANWTRAVRKAFPEGGPMAPPARDQGPETTDEGLKALTTAELNLELLRRALDRSGRALHAARWTADRLQAKHDARVREYAVQTEKFLTAKPVRQAQGLRGGAS